jgi:hypothetical protein
MLNRPFPCRTDVARLDASTSELKSETTTLNTNDATQKAQVDAIDQRLRSVERSATVAPAPAATTSTGPPPALMPPASPNSAFAGAHGGVTAPVMISPDMFRAATTPNAARKPPTPTSESMFSPFSLNQPVSSSAPLAPANRKTTMDTLGNLPSPKYANDTAVPQAKATTPSGQIHSHAHTQSQPSVQPPPLQSQTSFSKTQPLSAPPAQSSLHDWDKESSDVNERSEGDGTTAPSLAMGGINPIMLRDDAQQRALRQKQRQIGTLSPINSALIAAGPATPAVPAKVDSAQPASSATAVNRVDSPEQFSALAASPNRSLGTSEFDTDDGGDVELDLGDRSATPDVIRKLSAMPRNPRPVALPTAFGTTAPLGAFGRGNASGSSFTSPLMAPLGASNMANATMRTPVTSSLAGLGAPTAKPSGDEAKTRTRSPPGMCVMSVCYRLIILALLAAFVGRHVVLLSHTCVAFALCLGALASLGDIVTDGGSGEDVTDLSDDAAFDGSDIELDLGLAPKPTNYRLAGIGTHSTVAATTTAAAASVPLSTAPNLLTFGSLSSDGRKLSANSAAPPSGNLSRAISGSGGSGSIALAKSTSNLSAGASESAAEFPAFSSAVTSGRPSVKLGTSSSVTPVSEINEPARIGIDRPATRVSLGNLSPVSGSGAAHTPGGHSVNGLQIDAEDIMEDDSELDFPMTP